MKLFNCLMVSALATGVFGSKAAGGWEAVMYYYMYRMDYEANDAGSRSIATKCPGSHSKGGCNFAEFVDHYQRHDISLGKGKPKAGKFDPAKVPSDIDLENPDPNKASDIMDWEGTANPSKAPPKPGQDPPPKFFSYDASYDKVAMLGTKSGSVTNHGTFLEAMSDITEKNKAKGGEGNFKKVQSCLNNVIFGRQADNMINQQRDFQTQVLDKYANQPNIIKDKNDYLVSHTKDAVEPDSKNTYKVWDSDRMIDDINNHPTLSAAKKQDLLGRVTQYTKDYFTDPSLSEKPGSSGPTHLRDIRAAQAIRTKLNVSGASCST